MQVNGGRWDDVRCNPPRFGNIITEREMILTEADIEMATIERRSFLKSATLLTTGGIVASSAILATNPSLSQGVPGNSHYGVKALFFDMFGTVLDWRTGVALSAEANTAAAGGRTERANFGLVR
jgi:hypothetical protein